MAQEARISQNKDIFKLVSQELNLVPTEKDLITACKGLYIQYSGLEKLSCWPIKGGQQIQNVIVALCCCSLPQAIEQMLNVVIY